MQIFVIVGPSGSGKTTLARKVAEIDNDLLLAISETTRPRRNGDRDGVDYYFNPSRELFRRKVKAGKFLEWADVYGHLYGTLASEVARAMLSQRDLLLEIDFKGMCQVKEKHPDALTIFVHPPSVEALPERLRYRNRGETEQETALRLAAAPIEIARASQFDHQIVNDDAEVAVKKILDIVRQARAAVV